MLGACLSAEWMKLRHSYLWLVLLTLPLVSVLIGCANFYMNQAALQKEWYSLWSQVSLFYAQFFLPMLIAICCAYLCRLEHVNQNWNMLMSAPVPVAGLFFAKLIVAGVLLGLVQFIFAILYVIGGLGVGFTVSELPEELPGWLLHGWMASVTLSSLQLALSLRIRSFAAPVGIGLCAAFVGLGFYVAKAGLLYPHSLLTVGMGALSQEGLSAQGQWTSVVMNGLYTALFSAVAVRRLRTADVVA
ncbi:ABC transporter permease [Paenibacillus turpanensis]|uniref:ABC transporter permease n=1 Tax=Paenibacillus turpanensis TaxID=2689078 RepID=UPI003C7D0B55